MFLPLCRMGSRGDSMGLSQDSFKQQEGHRKPESTQALIILIISQSNDLYTWNSYLDFYQHCITSFSWQPSDNCPHPHFVEKQNWVSEKLGDLAAIIQLESGERGPWPRSGITNVLSHPVWWKDTTSSTRFSCSSNRYSPLIILSFHPWRYRPSIKEWDWHWLQLRQIWARMLAPLYNICVTPAKLFSHSKSISQNHSTNTFLAPSDCQGKEIKYKQASSHGAYILVVYWGDMEVWGWGGHKQYKQVICTIY